MGGGCGLQTWGSNSRCVLATSASALGPYVRIETLLDAWCHGSTPARDPLSGRWVAQHMGHAAPSATCTVCAAGGGITPPGAPQGPCPEADGVAAYTEGAVVSTGADPRGPYTAAPQVKSGANCENFFLPNGTLFVACPYGAKNVGVPDCGSPSQNACVYNIAGRASAPTPPLTYPRRSHILDPYTTVLTVSRAESLDAALAGEYTDLPLSYAPAGSSAPSEPMCASTKGQACAPLASPSHCPATIT